MTYSRPAGRVRRRQLLALQRVGQSAWARRHDPRLQVQAALAVLFAGAIAAFAHIVEDYLTGDPLVRWDVEFSRWLHVHSNPALVSIFKIVTIGGTVVFLALFTLAVALYLVRRRKFDEAALLCAAALGIEILNAVLKLVFHRPRPELAYVHLDTYSFPSGHAAGSSSDLRRRALSVGTKRRATLADPLRDRICRAGRADRVQPPVPRSPLPVRRTRGH